MNIYEIIRNKDLAQIAEISLTEPQALNFQPENGDPSALEYAVKEGDEQLVRYLLSRGADAWRGAALNIALEEGKLGIAQALLDSGADINALRGHFGKKTPLIAAIEKGNAASVKFALDHGADINKKSQESGHDVTGRVAVEESPLQIAIGWLKWKPDPTIVFMLLERGANVLQEGHLEVNYHYRTGNAVHSAAAFGTVEVFQEIVKHVPLEAILPQRPYGSPLAWAVAEENYKIIVFLLRMGAGPFESLTSDKPDDEFALYLIRRFKEKQGQLTEDKQALVNELLA